MHDEPRGITERRGTRGTGDLTPSRIAKTLRDAGPMTLSELYEAVGRRRPRQGYFASVEQRYLQPFVGILDRLARAGLIAQTDEGAMPVDASELLATWEESLYARNAVTEARWSVTPLLLSVQSALELSLGEVADARTHESEVARTREMSVEVDRKLAETGYGTDFAATLWEMGSCLATRSYIATIALSGKILELALKHRMSELDIPYQNDWMLGKLISAFAQHTREYLDPAIAQISNIIKESRNPAVHATTGVPIPSAEQAVMVVNAVLDTVRRLVLLPPPATREPFPAARTWNAFVHVIAHDEHVTVALIAQTPNGGEPRQRTARLPVNDTTAGFAQALYWIDNAYDARSAPLRLFVSDASLEETFRGVRTPTSSQAAFLASLEGRATVRIVHVLPDDAPGATAARDLAERTAGR